jgi:hypothetical protein
MKLKLVKDEGENTENFPSSKTTEDQEMAYLWERLSTNSHSDGEAVRQTILARMVYLTYERVARLPKY